MGVVLLQWGLGVDHQYLLTVIVCTKTQRYFPPHVAANPTIATRHAAEHLVGFKRKLPPMLGDPISLWLLCQFNSIFLTPPSTHTCTRPHVTFEEEADYMLFCRCEGSWWMSPPAPLSNHPVTSRIVTEDLCYSNSFNEGNIKLKIISMQNCIDLIGFCQVL